jgi:sRNA-binding regulator protein Hfq
MPFQMAMAVAMGRLDLNSALERMARQDRVNRLMEKHDLSRALATQVAMGHADLDLVLSRRRMAAHREANRDRSCLEQAKESGEPIMLALHGGKTSTVRVVEVAPYMVTVVPIEKKGAGGEPVEIHKLQIKYVYSPAAWKRVKKGVKSDAKLAGQALEPIGRPQDRYTCSDKRMFRYMDAKTPVQLTLLEGEHIKGTITWFGRYEFGLKLRGSDEELTVFRHSMHDLREA